MQNYRLAESFCYKNHPCEGLGLVVFASYEHSLVHTIGGISQHHFKIYIYICMYIKEIHRQELQAALSAGLGPEQPSSGLCCWSRSILGRVTSLHGTIDTVAVNQC